MNTIKQVVGVDVSQNELVCCFGRLFTNLNIELGFTQIIKNSPVGFQAFMAWVKSVQSEHLPTLVVMEATGVYHQKFAHWLSSKNQTVAIVLPNKISNYFRTLATKTITDTTSAQTIARFGLERKLDIWTPPNPLFKALQNLTRERDQIVQERTVIKNQLHAQQACADVHVSTIKRLKARMALLNAQQLQIQNELDELIQSEPTLSRDVELMTCIPGVGRLTAAIILGETNGFELVRNKRQLVSYAGLDVKQKQSGTSVADKPRISKKGNRHLRKALHLPALVAIRHYPLYKDHFDRNVVKHGIKMKAVVAIQRKILELAYVLWKSQSMFDPQYEMKKGRLYEKTIPSESGL